MMFVLQRCVRGLSMNSLRLSSSSSITAAAKITIDPSENKDTTNRNSKSKIVATAFESLKEISDDLKTQKLVLKQGNDEENNINEKIISAKTVSGLLSIAESNNKLTRKHALKIVSILSEWSSINRITLSEFENDARFLKLCRILGRTVIRNDNNTNPIKRISNFRTNDLNTVLEIAGDDEAAKLINNISLPQMVKILTALAHKKRRSVSLLRSLAFNISSSSEQLNLKQCSDVLYSIASLNFPDSVLLAKVCADIQSSLPANTDKSAVIGSILTSLGILKYRDIDILESLSQWILKYNEICRPQDISATFLTLATLNYKPQNLGDIKKLVNSLNKEDFPRPLDWLNHVWALCLLNLAESKEVDSVLKSDFIQQIEDDSKSFTQNTKLKLLNINGYAKLIISEYKGACLSEDSPVYSISLNYSKSKQTLVNGMLDTLKSLLTSNTCVRNLVDTKMGFLIDAECALDSKRNPLSLDKVDSSAIKIAVMVVDFHDLCHGMNRSLTGLTNLSFELLEKSGYKVLSVPYHEFNTGDKLLKRVQYLEKKFKDIVTGTN